METELMPWIKDLKRQLETYGPKADRFYPVNFTLSLQNARLLLELLEISTKSLDTPENNDIIIDILWILTRGSDA